VRGEKLPRKGGEREKGDPVPLSWKKEPKCHKSVTENLSTVGANDMLVIFYDGRLPLREKGRRCRRSESCLIETFNSPGLRRKRFMFNAACARTAHIDRANHSRNRCTSGKWLFDLILRQILFNRRNTQLVFTK
jgi:hypothetical protein